MIMPSIWMDAIWGATYAPEWDDIEEFELFNQLILGGLMPLICSNVGLGVVR
jgi:hypothetical protein